jgi:hypothetical protein
MLKPQVRTFLEIASAAAMVTLRNDGTPHLARCAIGLVDGVVLSSVLPDAIRNSHVRRDHRATLFVFDPMDPSNARRWLALDTAVTLHDGSGAADLSLRLRKIVQKRLNPPPPEGMVSWGGEVMTEEHFLAAVMAEGRLVYEFEVLRAYGPA